MLGSTFEYIKQLCLLLIKHVLPIYHFVYVTYTFSDSAVTSILCVRYCDVP